MISHATYVTYIALLSTHAALQLNQPQSPCSCAAEIFHFWLIRIHSNARNSILLGFNQLSVCTGLVKVHYFKHQKELPFVFCSVLFCFSFCFNFERFQKQIHTESKLEPRP